MRPWYDEVFQDSGDLRPAYSALAQRTGRDPLRPTPAAAESLRRRPLGDDVRILPVPLVLEDDEYRALVAGLAQRALALQDLFVDLVLGDQRVCTAGLGVDEALIVSIVAAEATSLPRLRDLWRRRDRDAVAFVYGPDLVREPGGRWTVIEDNVGCLGGSADSSAVVDCYADVTGIRPARKVPPDLPAAVARWFGRRGSGADLVVTVLGCDGPDGPGAVRVEENARRAGQLERRAIPVCTEAEFERCTSGTPVWARAAVANLDGRVREGSALHRAFSRGAALLNAPGTGLLGNKALLPFLDDLVRYYRGEEPLVPAPTTRLLTDGLPEPGDGWVVKSAAGHSGTEVFFLDGAHPRRLRQAQDMVRSRAGGAVAQRYVEPSRLTPGGGGSWDAWLVEIRPMIYVLGDGDLMAGATPAARLVSVYDHRRLNNLSQGACYAPVLRETCGRPARDA
jgi:uncharacterized circularly permuted ATP-grasp superfamily protein